MKEEILELIEKSRRLLSLQDLMDIRKAIQLNIFRARRAGYEREKRKKQNSND